MKKFLKCLRLLVVAVGLFALGYFAPRIPNLVSNLYSRSWFGADVRDPSVEYLEQPAAYASFDEQNEPVLLPSASIDWQMKSVDEWLTEQGHHDINFTLSQEKSLDQDWLSL